MKKVLFIYPSFHEYPNRIKKEIEKKGYKVDGFCSTLSLNTFERIADYVIKGKDIGTRLFKKRQNKRILKYIKNIDNDYNYVFVLNGRNLDFKIINKIKEKLNKAKFILYLWDNIKYIESINEKLCFFDSIYSFDKNDCKKFNLKFLPLFYTSDFTTINKKKNIDIFYCGNLHSDRFELLMKLISFSNDNNIDIKAFLVLNYLGYIKRLFTDKNFNKYSSFIEPKQVCLEKFANFLCTSKSCLDIHAPLQTGLTMRCIESLPAQCKIITTNEHIKEYDFYCPENVMIIDRENPVFDVDFIKTPYKPISKEIVEKYSLENWIKTIFRE